MPKKTFLNLSKEKQNIIIEASLKEFKRVLLKDASINKIIKDAQISRGSFYNYFNDINDIYFYSLNEYKGKLISLIKEILIKNNGELIKTTIEIYDEIINYSNKEENKNLVKNIFLNFNYQNEVRTKIYKYNIDNKYEFLELISLIDKKNLNIRNEEEIFYIIDIIIVIIIQGIIETLIDSNKKEDSKEKIHKQIEILKRGIWKED